MKNLILFILLLSSTTHSFASVTNKVEWIRNEIATKTPKTNLYDEGYRDLPKDVFVYRVGGVRMGMRGIRGISYFFADQVYSNLTEDVYHQFYNDTNTAVKAVGLICLSRANIDFDILEGDTTKIFITDPTCYPGHTITLEEFSRDLKYDPWMRWYYGAISYEEYEKLIELEQNQSTATNSPNN